MRLERALLANTGAWLSNCCNLEPERGSSAPQLELATVATSSHGGAGMEELAGGQESEARLR